MGLADTQDPENLDLVGSEGIENMSNPKHLGMVVSQAQNNVDLGSMTGPKHLDSTITKF